MNVPYTPDKYAAAIAMLERRITETAIAAAPILGLLPNAIITANHCGLYLHFDPIFSTLTGIGVESVSVAIVATRVLLPDKGLAHRERDMDRAFIGYIVALATVNLGLNVFHGFTIGWTPDLAGVTLAELALGLLAIPVAWLVATRHEIATVAAAADEAKATAAGLRAEQDAKDEKIRAEERQFQLDLIAAKGEQRRADKLAQAEKQVGQVVNPPQQVATTQKRGHVDLAILADKLKQDPTLTNDALGIFFHVSGEAVRLARKKL